GDRKNAENKNNNPQGSSSRVTLTLLTVCSPRVFSAALTSRHGGKPLSRPSGGHIGSRVSRESRPPSWETGGLRFFGSRPRACHTLFRQGSA
ncbi:Hypothetical predicted protein, partial [Pelobates cultripes]